MNCRIVLNTISDRGYWINWEKFFYYINQDDFTFLESQTVLAHYSSKWFHGVDEEGVYLFQPPSFNLQERKVKFENGRHLFLLLSRHMNHFPMVLTYMNPEHQWILEEISDGLLDESDIFEMPDLEFKKAI
jgi:predicted porin